jgi:hypothetical protein
MTDPSPIVGPALLVASVAAGIAVGILAGRRHGRAIAIATGMTLFVGVLSAGLAVGHLIGVIVTAAGRGYYYSYDFRFAALLLIGITILVAGALSIAAVRGLGRGQEPAWARAMSGTLLLLVINTPLIPVQSFAVALSILGTLNLIALLGARRRLEAS